MKKGATPVYTVGKIERMVPLHVHRNATDYPMPTVYHLTLLLDKQFINPFQEKFSQVQNKVIKAACNVQSYSQAVLSA